jgi:low temperature requirement protein LtrA
MTDASPLPSVASRRWLRVMVARDRAEPDRASTALELLFDLTFVVAVAQAATELSHSLAAGHAGSGTVSYLMVFFAIWWAWMNFTWFASAYDNDDVPYRLLTLLQMAGVLVLAAGVPSAFEDAQFTTVTAGYVIMRVAMIGQWLRAARSDPAGRACALFFAGGIAVVQAGWLLRLTLPEWAGMAGFAILVAAELTVPPLAERRGPTAWNPDHITERYGLFTIIVLGECVAAATNAVQATRAGGGLTTNLASIAAGGLALLFGLWWLYFLRPAGEHLRRRPQLGFLWGYLHYAIFAAGAAVGSGLEVAAEAGLHDVAASSLSIALDIAVPTVAFLLILTSLHSLLAQGHRPGPSHALFAGALILALALTAAVLPVGAAVLLMSLPIAGLIAFGVSVDHHLAVA